MRIRSRLLSVNVSLGLFAFWLLIEGYMVGGSLTTSRDVESHVHDAQKAVVDALDIANMSFHNHDFRSQAFAERINEALLQLEQLEQQPSISGTYLITIRKIYYDLNGLQKLYQLVNTDSTSESDADRMAVSTHLHERLQYELLLQLKHINELRSNLQFDISEMISQLYIRAILVYGIIALVVFILVGSLTRQFQRGLVWLSDMTSQVEKGELEFKTDFSERDEFSVLARAFVRMADSLRKLMIRKTEMEKLIQDRTNELESLTVTDPLTGALNRRALNSISATEVSRAQRSGHSMSVIMSDIDLFKTINDGHGHFAGDQVLVAVSRCLRAGLRDHDFLFRYGGEEFLLLLPETESKEALTLAERLCERIRSLQVTVGGRSIHVTMSCGVASQSGSILQFDALLKHADSALYEAKHSGRDCCVVY